MAVVAYAIKTDTFGNFIFLKMINQFNNFDFIILYKPVQKAFT